MLVIRLTLVLLVLTLQALGVTKSVCASGCDHATMALCESVNGGSLSTPITCEGQDGQSDTSALSVAGNTLTATNFFEFTVDASNRHDGGENLSKYRFTWTDASGIISDDYVRISWLQFIMIDTGGNDTSIVIQFIAAANDIRIQNNLFIGADDPQQTGIIIADVDADTEISNNVFSGYQRAFNGAIRVDQCADTNIWYNTFDDNEHAVRNETSCAGTVQLIGNISTNNVLASSSDDYWLDGGSWASGTDYNLSDTASATGGGNDLVSKTITYEDAANDIYLLDAGETDPIDVAEVTTCSVPADILSTARPQNGTCDMGIQERISGAAPSFIPFVLTY